MFMNMIMNMIIDRIEQFIGKFFVLNLTVLLKMIVNLIDHKLIFFIMSIILRTKNLLEIIYLLFAVCSASSDYKRIKLPSFDSSHCDASNGGRFMSLDAMYGEIFGKTSTIRHFSFMLLRHFDILLNCSTTIAPRAIKLLPFDASR